MNAYTQGYVYGLEDALEQLRRLTTQQCEAWIHATINRIKSSSEADPPGASAHPELPASPPSSLAGAPRSASPSAPTPTSPARPQHGSSDP